jgi:hypothetical protein
MTFTVETARIDTRANTEELFYEVIEYFRLYTGVESQVADTNFDLVVYPNPATNNIVIHNNGKTEITDGLFELYDINGRKVLSRDVNFATDTKISLSGLNRGFYIYRVLSGNRILTGKIVKQ